METLKRISDAHVNAPEGFTVHPKVLPQLQRRAAAINEGPIDWGTGEILAFGSLLMDGRPVRLSGQDSRRGTFVSRFATIIDRKNADEWTPLANLTEEQAQFYVYDSLLSEYAVLGFEYGYSVARPDALVLWEAQFGDFVNGAQTVIDEFITSSHTKWRQQSGVVLLLPHGYEGQGPDHSSARIERFLAMGADEAFVVAQPSTPASYFHLLRKHSLGEEHRPLIVFTPKSMLKRKEAASQPKDFTEGTFRPVIGDDQVDAEQGREGAAVQRPDHLGPDGGAQEAGGRHAAHGDRPRRAALPAPGRGAQGRAREVPEPQGGPLGAGRARQHGPVAAHGAEPHAGAGRHPVLPGVPSGVVLPLGGPALAAHRGAEGAHRSRRSAEPMYFTDRGLEELEKRRGDEEVTLAWVADRMQEFVDTFPEFEIPVERLATWLARLDDPDDE